jgi:hypothetical protein
MLREDGSMQVRFEWGNANGNPISDYSSIALPVGEWFNVEMYWQWSESATLRVWINGQLALEQTGVRTRAPSHTSVEMYVKFYGSTQGHTPWDPTPTVRYTRNVRVAATHIVQ